MISRNHFWLKEPLSCKELERAQRNKKVKENGDYHPVCLSCSYFSLCTCP